MTGIQARHRTMVEQFTNEFLNTGDPSAADRFIAPDCVLHWGGQRQTLQGPEAYRRVLRTVREAFPDIRWTIEDVVAEGEKVCVRARATATHAGTFMGVPATGRTVTLEGLALFTIVDGRIGSEWAMPNLFGLMEQIRAPAPEPGGGEVST